MAFTAVAGTTSPTAQPAIAAPAPMSISLSHDKTSFNNGRCYQEVTATIANWTDQGISASAMIVGGQLSSHEQAGDPVRSLVIGTDAAGHGQIQIHFWASGETPVRGAIVIFRGGDEAQTLSFTTGCNTPVTVTESAFNWSINYQMKSVAWWEAADADMSPYWSAPFCNIGDGSIAGQYAGIPVGVAGLKGADANCP